MLAASHALELTCFECCHPKRTCSTKARIREVHVSDSSEQLSSVKCGHAQCAWTRMVRCLCSLLAAISPLLLVIFLSYGHHRFANSNSRCAGIALVDAKCGLGGAYLRFQAWFSLEAYFMHCKFRAEFAPTRNWLNHKSESPLFAVEICSLFQMVRFDCLHTNPHQLQICGCLRHNGIGPWRMKIMATSFDYQREGVREPGRIGGGGTRLTFPRPRSLKRTQTPCIWTRSYHPRRRMIMVVFIGWRAVAFRLSSKWPPLKHFDADVQKTIARHWWWFTSVTCDYPVQYVAGLACGWGKERNRVTKPGWKMIRTKFL